MQVLHTEIPIRASSEIIWKTLVVSPSIPKEIRNAIRDRKIGQTLSVPMSTGGRSANLTVKLLIVDPCREIRWKGFFRVPGLFDGEHSFEILEEQEGMTRLVQRETFTGLLLPSLSSATKHKFKMTNASIRDTAEQSVL